MYLSAKMDASLLDGMLMLNGRMPENVGLQGFEWIFSMSLGLKVD